MSSQINYAKAVGYNSQAAAFFFSILYLPFSGWFIRQMFVRPSYVHFILLLFTQIRLAAFILRDILVSVESVGERLNILIVDEILFGVGFFSLLYSSYILMLDIEIMQNRPKSSSLIIRLTKNRHLFRLVLSLAVALGVVASTSTSNDGSTSHTGKILRQVSTIIFLVLTVFQVIQTLLLAQMEIATSREEKRTNESFGARHAMSILFVGAVLLLVREAFSTATMTDLIKQNNEHLWYPLVAVPEILIVALMSIPGLVPRRDEVKPKYPEDSSMQAFQPA